MGTPWSKHFGRARHSSAGSWREPWCRKPALLREDPPAEDRVGSVACRGTTRNAGTGTAGLACALTADSAGSRDSRHSRPDSAQTARHVGFSGAFGREVEVGARRESRVPGSLSPVRFSLARSYRPVVLGRCGPRETRGEAPALALKGRIGTRLTCPTVPPEPCTAPDDPRH